MAIKLPQGLEITSKQPVDSRILLSKQEMRNITDGIMPIKYFAICSDDGKLYLYDKNNEINEITGKFRLFEISSEELSVKLPNALKNTLNNQSLKDSGLLVDDNGNIKVNLNEEHLKIIDNQIDLAVSLIQAIDSN